MLHDSVCDVPSVSDVLPQMKINGIDNIIVTTVIAIFDSAICMTKKYDHCHSVFVKTVWRQLIGILVTANKFIATR